MTTQAARIVAKINRLCETMEFFKCPCSASKLMDDEFNVSYDIFLICSKMSKKGKVIFSLFVLLNTDLRNSFVFPTRSQKMSITKHSDVIPTNVATKDLIMGCLRAYVSDFESTFKFTEHGDLSCTPESKKMIEAFIRTHEFAIRLINAAVLPPLVWKTPADYPEMSLEDSEKAALSACNRQALAYYSMAYMGYLRNCRVLRVPAKKEYRFDAKSQ